MLKFINKTRGSIILVCIDAEETVPTFEWVIGKIVLFNDGYFFRADEISGHSFKPEELIEIANVMKELWGKQER